MNGAAELATLERDAEPRVQRPAGPCGEPACGAGLSKGARLLCALPEFRSARGSEGEPLCCAVTRRPAHVLARRSGRAQARAQAQSSVFLPVLLTFSTHASGVTSPLIETFFSPSDTS